MTTSSRPVRQNDNRQAAQTELLQLSTLGRISTWLTAACVMLFSFLAFAVVTHNDITLLDVRIVNWLADQASATLTPLAFLITTFGSPLFITFVVLAGAIASYVRFKSTRLVCLFLAVGIGAGAVMSLLKVIFHRARPVMAHPLDHEVGFSFPSGHATMSAALYGLLILLVVTNVKRRWLRITLSVLLSALIFAIAVSRIYLGVHYPVDVTGGVCLGTAWTCMCFAIYAKAAERAQIPR